MNFFLVINKKVYVYLFFFSISVFGDNFNFNNYNNHGVVGLINTPSARFFDQSVHGVTIYNGTPAQKVTLTSNPYDWLEASFFYTNLENKRYCDVSFDPVCKQDYKDKGFNFKIRVKEEGYLPAIAIGINDIAGTGFFSSEYIVSSYGIGNMDFHFGVGWGTLNGSDYSFVNPLGKIYDGFYDRPTNTAGKGGQFQPSRYFSGPNASPFFGISYAYNDKLSFKIENDTTLTPGKVKYKDPDSQISFGIDYAVNKNFSIGFSGERGNVFSLKFVYKNNPLTRINNYEYKAAETQERDDKYSKLVRNLERNGVGVNKIIETSSSIGLELTQFVHPSIEVIEEIIKSASIDAGIKKDVKKDIKIANLSAYSELSSSYNQNYELIYERKKTRAFSTNTNLKFRPFIASREEFFKGALVAENNTEFVITDSLFFNTNLKYTIADNFDDLKYPPVNTFPAQVRSDIKQYLKNMDKGVLIGRAQLDYHITPKTDHHIMVSGGILEDMFSGYGLEYLYYKQNTNYAVGFELFEVYKRDYDWGFGTLDYKNVTGSMNLYYRNYGSIPFDMKISYGEYLAGDFGSTIEFSRSFKNGTKFGIFASFTDVTSEQFGEGTFDKGIFFNIPIYGNFINYTWRPLTKDPGAKLNRRHDLHGLLVKFKPINNWGLLIS